MTDQNAPTPRATANRSTVPVSEIFRRFISSHWAEPQANPLDSTGRSASKPDTPREQSCWAAARRNRLSALYGGKRLIIAAGAATVRSNDTDYPYRAHSAFSFLTGWASDTVPASVLVFEPTAKGHEATLYFRQAAGRDSDEFYANSEIGEFWTGPRPTLAQVAHDLGLGTADLAEFDPVLELIGADFAAETIIVRDADRALTDQIDGRRLLLADLETLTNDADRALARDLSEMRLVKDNYEVEQLRRAVAATKLGFDDVIADRGAIIAHERGERLVEGTFNRRARAEGNAVGYDTIAASGRHACILHWTRNDGAVMPGDLILVDAGIELDSLYTADITRTLPVNGVFSPTQRQIYEAVLEAADAAFAVVRPGIRFREIHHAAMAVIAQKTAQWGLLPVGVEEAMLPQNQHHRRYMVHGTSHHLGLDVHDCAQARRELYLDGVLEAGMVFTIEPGLYFQPDDLTVPEDFRGIGVRIEDNILVTATGAENLSILIPRTVDDVEAWLR